MADRFHLLFPNGKYPAPLPGKLNNPFRYQPCDLSLIASRAVLDFLDSTDTGHLAEEGKMFGVLVVQKGNGDIGYLAAFSGLLGKLSDHPFFVPPIYDLCNPEGFFKKGEAQIIEISRQIETMQESPSYRNLLMEIKESEASLGEYESSWTEQFSKEKKERSVRREGILSELNRTTDEEQIRHFRSQLEEIDRESMFAKAEHRRECKRLKKRLLENRAKAETTEREIEKLKKLRKERSSELQDKIFKAFLIRNHLGGSSDLLEIFKDSTAGYPPAGTGECAAPKLFQYAFMNSLHPIAVAEFWYGRTNGSEMRIHGHFYPACTGKCGPLLKYMLGEEITGLRTENKAQPQILYDDEYIAVVDKPYDYLSVPGRSDRESVYSFIRQRYPKASGSIVPHRLDMDTSGLLVIAKDETSFSRIREQFENRTVKKVYRAILDGEIHSSNGSIDLPIAPDYLNRPRQKVDFTDGKEAITEFKSVRIFPMTSNGETRILTEVLFYPHTGRTHQLRIHSAHPDGLNAPILGDPLYGKAARRMYLHAESIEFTHPVTGERLSFRKEADFRLQSNGI